MVADGDPKKLCSIRRILEDTCGVTPISFATWYKAAEARIMDVQFDMILLGHFMPRFKAGEEVEPIGYDLLPIIKRCQIHDVRVIGLSNLKGHDKKTRELCPERIICVGDMLQAIPAVIKEVRELASSV